MTKQTTRKRNRSGHEPCPICLEKTILVEHHINGRDVVGANMQWNLVNICDNCHRKIHNDIIVVEGWKSTSDGPRLFWHHKGELSFTGDVSQPHLFDKKSTQFS